MKYIYNKINFFLIFFFLVLDTAANEVSNPKILKVALLPDENAAKIIQDNQKLINLLSEELGKEVEIIVSTDYSSMIEAIRFKRIHVGYFGPFSYTIAKSKTNITPFAARSKNGKTKYRSVIIGNKKQNIAKLEDIRAKNFGFGDPASTSSHLIPKKMLIEENIFKEESYNEVFLGSHDAVAIATQNGVVQAGGLSEPILNILVEKKIIDKSKITILKYSDYFPQYPWVYIDDLEDDLKKKIENFFYNLDDIEVLKKFKADGFLKVNDKDYDVIRNLSQKLELYEY